MIAFLKKPYPYAGELKKDLRGNLLIGLFIAFFLVIFQPFGIAGWETPDKVLKLAGFGLISAIVPSLISAGSPYLLKGKFREEKWNIGFEILYILAVLLLIAFCNLLYGRFLGISAISLPNFMYALFSTMLIGLFPVSYHVITKHNRLLKRNLEQSRIMNEKLKPAIPAATQSPELNSSAPLADILVLVAENEKDRLQLSLESLLYIESADNYSCVFIVENGKLKKEMLRSSLKRIEAQVSGSAIVRCHRTYMVNLNQVREVEGNAAGYKLHLYCSEQLIPVSRSYIPKLMEVLKARS